MQHNRNDNRMMRLLAVLLALALLFTGCTKPQPEPNEPKEPDPPIKPAAPVLPDELAVLRDNLTLLVSNEASRLSGSAFVTTFLDMLRSGSGTSYKEYGNLKATLDQLALTYGAYQVYVLTDLDDDLTSYEVAVASNTNGGQPICLWAEHHRAEYALNLAMNGTSAADMFARTWKGAAADGSDILTWTAFAPLFDADESIAAILAFEYPKTALLADHPEWNRMNAAWNGVTEPAE